MTRAKLTRTDSVLGDTYDHPSFGMASFSRCSGSAHLFGSALKHHHFITLSIHKACMCRDPQTHTTSTFAKDVVVEVEMSEAQFGQLISTFNRGDGVPVTIHRIGGQLIDPAPEDAMHKSFRNELVQDLHELVVLAEKLATVSETLCSKKGALTAAEKKDLKESADRMVRELKHNMPFLQQQFENAMEGVVSQAVAEVEAHVQSIIARTGIAALAQSRPELPALEPPVSIDGEVTG